MTSINKQAKVNKTKSEVKVEFSDKNLTPCGGLGLFSKFSRKLGVEKALDKIRIKQGALGFGLEVSPCHRYGGNAAYFQPGMLATRSFRSILRT